MGAFLYLNDRQIKVATLREVGRETEIPGFNEIPPYFQEVLSFCWKWLYGEEYFTIHTSGSTGVPKFIKLSRSQMEASARMTLRALGLGPAETALVCLNTAYIAGKMMLVRGLEAGMSMVVIPPSSRPFRQVPGNMSITFTAMVPLQVQTSLESGDVKEHSGFRALKALLVGGAPVSYSLQQAIRTYMLPPVYSTYGMTETVSHIALKRLNGVEKDESYAVLDDIEIGTDPRGCLTIRGAVTNFQKLVTNDMVKIIDERHFEWIGRADYVINSGGVKIFPEKIESVVEHWMEGRKHTAHFFVGGLPDKQLGEKAVLVVEGRPMPPEQEEALLDFLRQKVAVYEVPKAIYYLPAFVKTETGKVRRKHTLASIF